MGTSPGRRIIWMAIAAVSLVSCGAQTTGINGSPLAIPDLQGIPESIASTAHYPANTIEITSSATRLRISMRDAKLAISDEGTCNAAAASLVAVPSGRFSAHIT